MSELLPVHGFVLAGGRSSRMGTDKALLEFNGTPMVEIALGKLRQFCTDVSLAGNLDGLEKFGPVVRESLMGSGPVAGVEAGLRAMQQDWALFMPVDVPLVPASLLESWAREVISIEKDPEREFFGPLLCSYLYTVDHDQPAFCMLHRSTLAEVAQRIDQGERRLLALLSGLHVPFGAAAVVRFNAAQFSPKPNPTALDLEYWFLNVNTPNDFDVAEAWALEPPDVA